MALLEFYETAGYGERGMEVELAVKARQVSSAVAERKDGRGVGRLTDGDAI